MLSDKEWAREFSKKTLTREAMIQVTKDRLLEVSPNLDHDTALKMATEAVDKAILEIIPTKNIKPV